MKKKLEVVNASSLSQRNTVLSIMIIALLFFIFGFTTWINAILIPYFKISCELNNALSLLVAFAFYIAYFVMAIPAAHLLEKVGFKKGIMVGFWIMAVGALIFVPAALTRTYWIFLLGLFSIGTGLAILQPAANTYITLIGSKERAAQRMSIMGVCNKTAGIIAPLLLAAAILRPTDTELFKQLPLMDEITRDTVLDELIRRVIVPYSVMSVVLFGLGLMIRYSILPEIDTNNENPAVARNSGKTNIIHFPHLILGGIAIFLHVGSQVVGINTIIGYAQALGLPLLEAKVFPSYILGITMLGFLLGIVLIPKYINHLRVLRICTTSATLLTLLFFVVNGNIVTFLGHTADLSIWILVLLGLSNSLMYSTIWPLALNGLGRFTKMGGSILVMGLSGSAIIPLIYGSFADRFNTHTAYWVLLPCYIYLVYYAYFGYRVKYWTLSTKSD